MYPSTKSESVQPCAPSPGSTPHRVDDAQRASVDVVVGRRAEMQARVDARQGAVLAAITYGVERPRIAGTPLSFAVPLDPVGDSPDTEIWYSHLPVQHGMLRGISYARTDDALFGYITLRQGDERFEVTVQRAYAQLLAAIDDLDRPHLLRVWNYFSAINADEQGMERYQRFCIGRHRAFEAHYVNRMTERLPAASAIGTRDSDLVIYFLAARDGGQHLENPRQVSAYCYPKQYGPSSPTFSRATLKRWPQGAALYLSGTASVVGHESLHVDDAIAQTRETLANIRALFASAPGLLDASWNQKATMLKVYVRDARFADAVRDLAHAEFGAGCPVITLHGDICRRDLLLEIEGVYTR